MGKLPYLSKKTEQKQRGYIIASEFGGPLDVTSWVAYKDNLEILPNLYEGKLVYVYEDNQIYVYTKIDDTLGWQRLTNNHKITGNTEFKLLFYQGTGDIPLNEIIDNGTHPDTEIQARLYVKTGDFYRRFGNTYNAYTSDDRRYNNDIVYEWYNNNRLNPITKVSDSKDYMIKVSTDNVFSLSNTVYECGYLICVVRYKDAIVACNRIKYLNNQLDAEDKKRGLYYLSNKSSMLQRGFLMTNEQGGGVDATCSVNSTSDLDNFTNNYLGKLVYSYQDDAYMYLSSNEGARYTTYNKAPEEKAQYVKEHTTGTWNPIGSLDMVNNVSFRWEITGKNYGLSHNSITKDNQGNVLKIITDQDWRPEQLQERYNNHQTAEYEAHLYVTVNGVETEVDSTTIWSTMANNSVNNDDGKVLYKWTVTKPEGEEYYDRETDYDDEGHPYQDPDQNRTVWINGLDYSVVNGVIKDASAGTFDFKQSPYKTNKDNANNGEDRHGFYGVEVEGNYMEILYTNDYDDTDFVDLVCTAYFKDEQGKIRYIDSPTYRFHVSSEHLVYVLEDDKGDSKLQLITPDEGTFIIDGGSSADISDFTLTDNEYKIGYGIMYYPDEASATAGAYTMTPGANGTLVYEFYCDPSDNVMKLNPDNLMELHEPVARAAKDGTFEFKFNVLDHASKMPFGWYRIFVFRREYETDLLYTSKPYHHFQTVSNATNYVYPENVWMGYYGQDNHQEYGLEKDHTYLATIQANGTNLLYKNIPTIENGQIVQHNTSSVLHSKPNNIWTPCTNNASYTQINATQGFTDPRTQEKGKNRYIDLYYYDETDKIIALTDHIKVYNVLIPDPDLVVDSIYKWPDGRDIFVYNTTGYTILNPTPYGIPYIGSDSQVSPVEDGLEVVTNYRWTYNGVPTSNNPKLDFGGTFEVIADVNNRANVITDQYTSLTGKTFSPTVYDLKITIEQPSIHNDSDYYESNTPYQIVSHIWYRTDDTDNWIELPQSALGEVTYTWTESEGSDIFFSNVEELSHERTITGTNINGGYNNAWISFYDDYLVFAYAKVTAKVFGYTISTVEELKVRNPIDVLDVSHKIYTGVRNFKSYGLTDTRQLEEEWIELTITPTLVDWFTWDKITTTLKFMIDGELVDENSSKYTIEYENDGRNHFYEGTFKVIWKNNDDLPDTTFVHPISLNKRTNNYTIPVNLVNVTGFHLYPLGHDGLNIGYPADNNIFINAKVGTTQRYVLVIEGTGLDDDPRFLKLTKKGFKETLAGAVSIGSTASQTNIEIGSSTFTNVMDTPTKIVYYINDNVTANTQYDVTYEDANETHTHYAKTYVYNNDSIKGFYTQSAYYEAANGNRFSFLDERWVNVVSTFAPSYTYIPVVVQKTVTDQTTKFTSKAEYDLHNIGITSGNNVLVLSREDEKHVYSIDINHSYDTFTAVIKDHSTDVSDSLPTDTDVYYTWQHEGPCIVQSPTDTMDKNYLVLYNDSDSDVTEDIHLSIKILHHPTTFINWHDETIGISDYVMNKSLDDVVIPRLLYSIELAKKSPLNLTIGQEYSMSDIFDSITTTMYRYDLDHIIERKTWTGSQLNDTSGTSQLFFTALNTASKPAILANKVVTVSSDNGTDIKVEWKRTLADTKATGNASFTSSIVKTSISINPSSNLWDLKVVPTINTTITLVGQNLMYGYNQEGDSFLYVVESNKPTHKLPFNPGISSNAPGTYKYISSYTDTGHNMGYNDNNVEIDEEARTYNYVFGSNIAAFTANYQNRKITNVTISDKCTIVNKTYSSIQIPFSIDSVNMYGPNVDIINNEYDLTWSSTPTGSTIEGTFDSDGGNVGSGTLTLAETTLTNDQPVSITVNRENVTNTYSNTVNVAKIAGISSNTSQTYVKNAKVTVTFTGEHLTCAGKYYLGILNGSSYVTLGSEFTPNNDTSYTYTASLPDNTTYNASVARTIKVWMKDGSDQSGQYATHTFAAENPVSLSISVVSGSVSGSTIACNATSGTLSWKGNVIGHYSDGTQKTLESNKNYSTTITGIDTNCCKTGQVDRPVSTTWTVAGSTYNSAAGASTTVSGIIKQNGDSGSYSYETSASCPSSVAYNASTYNISGTRYINWDVCGKVNDGSYTETSNNFGTNTHTESTRYVNLSWSNFGKTCNNVLQGADTKSCSWSVSSNPTISACTTTHTLSMTSSCTWNDGTSAGSSSDTCIRQNLGTNGNNGSARTVGTYTCHGKSYTITQSADTASATGNYGNYGSVSYPDGQTITSCQPNQSRRVRVVGYKQYKWACGGNTYYSSESSTFDCTKTVVDSNGNFVNLTGDCYGVSYSFNKNLSYDSCTANVQVTGTRNTDRNELVVSVSQGQGGFTCSNCAGDTISPSANITSGYVKIKFYSTSGNEYTVNFTNSLGSGGAYGTVTIENPTTNTLAYYITGGVVNVGGGGINTQSSINQTSGTINLTPYVPPVTNPCDDVTMTLVSTSSAGGGGTNSWTVYIYNITNNSNKTVYIKYVPSGANASQQSQPLYPGDSLYQFVSKGQATCSQTA